MKREIIIARLHDGLGNQLFIYAAARAIALARGAELLLDATSGFARDRKYGAISQINHFAIAAGFAPARLCYPPPFGRQLRDLQVSLSQVLPLAHRFVVREADFDAIRAGAPLRPLVRLEGYWQSERYFAYIAETIAEELRIVSPLSPQSAAVNASIASTNSVALHVRQRRGAHHDDDNPPANATPQLPFSYYEEAIARVAARVEHPVFFCFGDNPDWMRERWKFPYPVHFVDHNRTQDRSHEDLALMRACNHFVVGNSTFSWWGAWLGRHPGKYVVAPASEGKFVWGSETDIIPARWDALKIAGA
jgi:hypothetical protein